MKPPRLSEAEGFVPMMRIAVTGSMGRGGDLADRAGGARVFEIVLLGRRVFLALEDRRGCSPRWAQGREAGRSDQRRRHYTAVDRAEAEESLARRHQRRRGRPRGGSRRPDQSASVHRLSPITCSTVRSIAPTVRTIRPGREPPIGAPELLGERLIAERCAQQRHRAHRLK